MVYMVVVVAAQNHRLSPVPLDVVQAAMVLLLVMKPPVVAAVEVVLQSQTMSRRHLLLRPLFHL